MIIASIHVYFYINIILIMTQYKTNENILDITNLNIPQLIRTGQYFHKTSLIKNYEDTLQKIFQSSKNSQMIQIPDIFLWKINNNIDDFDNNNDLFENMNELSLDIFGMSINDISQNIVISGPYVRSKLVKTYESSKCKIRNEIYLYRCGNEKWNDLIDLSNFDDKKTEYMLQNNDKIIYLVKKKYKSPAHIILQHGYLKRCGWYNGSYYVSSMFLIEMQKHLNLITPTFKDPITNLPYDPLGIYTLADKDKSHPTKIIECINYDELIKIPQKNLDKLHSGKTCLELCLDRYLVQDHPVLIEQMKQMIWYLSSNNNIAYKRPPFLYAKSLGIDIKMPELYKILQNVKHAYDLNNDMLDDINTSSLDDINNGIISALIKHDFANEFYEYTQYCKIKINKTFVNKIIDAKATKIANLIISCNMIDINISYYLILMVEQLDLIEKLQDKFDIDIAMNYLNELLEHGKIKSFYFLFEMDQSILSALFDSNRNVLHQIKPNGDYVHMVKVIMKLNPDLINMCDIYGETPLLYHSKHNPLLLDIFANYNFDGTIADSNGNIFLHNLVKHDCPQILNKYLKQCSELIDMPNKQSETPLMISCMHNRENMFYALKSSNANLNTKDSYGNSIYHYICANAMCLGIIIDNTPNHFGLTPFDYAKISPSFWTFE